MVDEVAALKDFLFVRMYRHPRVVQSMQAAQRVVADLFGAFMGNPALLPADWGRLCLGTGETATVSVVRDYIAGMTDRFALQEHGRIFHTEIVF